MTKLIPIKTSLNKKGNSSAGFYICKVTDGKFCSLGLIGGINNEFIKKSLNFHEETFPLKVNECVDSFKKKRLQLTPVLLAFKHDKKIEKYLKSTTENQAPNFKFLNKNIYEFWKIDDLTKIVNLYKPVKEFLVMDGHHRIKAFKSLDFESMMAFIVSEKNLLSKAICRKYYDMDSAKKADCLKALQKKFKLIEGESFSKEINHLLIAKSSEDLLRTKFNEKSRLEILHFLTKSFSAFNFSHHSIDDYDKDCRHFNITIPQLKLKKNLKFRKSYPPYSSWFEPKIPQNLITMKFF